MLIPFLHHPSFNACFCSVKEHVRPPLVFCINGLHYERGIAWSMCVGLQPYYTISIFNLQPCSTTETTENELESEWSLYYKHADCTELKLVDVDGVRQHRWWEYANNTGSINGKPVNIRYNPNEPDDERYLNRYSLDTPDAIITLVNEDYFLKTFVY